MENQQKFQEHKEYHKEFEDVFTSDKVLRRVHVEDVVVSGLGLGGYIEYGKKLFADYFDSFFCAIVRLSWLKRKFKVLGRGLGASVLKKGLVFDRTYSHIFRSFMSRDQKVLTRSCFGRIASYMDELFPEFDSQNPFDNPEYFKFPFSFIHVDYLVVVYQMDERMKLLEKAESEKMRYPEFLDFILNYINVKNEKEKKRRYDFKLVFDRPFYVRDNFKHTYAKTKTSNLYRR